MINKYVHIIAENGVRITSILDNMLQPVGEKELIKQAKEQYPNADKYIYGDDTMLDEFIAGKLYKNGTFVEPPVVEYTPTKVEKIAYIKKYYDERFATLDKALLRRQLINGDVTDLQTQFKQLNLEMVAKIKGAQ